MSSEERLAGGRGGRRWNPLRLARLAWRRFGAIDGWNLALLFTFNGVLTLLPVLVVTFAFLDVAASSDRNFAVFLVRRLQFDTTTAGYIGALFAAPARSRAAATVVSFGGFVIFGGSLVTQVQSAFDRSWNPTADPHHSMGRGIAWLFATAAYTIAVIWPDTFLPNVTPAAGVPEALSFIQALTFWWWTGWFLSVRRRPLLSYLPGALWIAACFAFVTAIANPLLGPVLNEYEQGFGTFGLSLVLAAMLFVMAAAVVFGPCVTAAWWEFVGSPREHARVVHRRSWWGRGETEDVPGAADGVGDVDVNALADVVGGGVVASTATLPRAGDGGRLAAPPELIPRPDGTEPSWVRFTSYPLRRAVARVQASARSVWVGVPVGVYSRYKDTDGQNLASAVALAGLFVAVPLLTAAVALVGAQIASNRTLGDALVELLAVRGRGAMAVRAAVAASTSSRPRAWLALVLVVPFTPLLVTNAERLVNRPWRPTSPDVRNVRRSFWWMVLVGVVVVQAAIPFSSDRVPVSVQAEVVIRGVVVVVLSTAVLTQIRRPWRAHLPGVVFGCVAVTAVTLVGGAVLGTWVVSYVDLFGPVGIVMVALTWAWLACAVVAVAPDVNAVLDERTSASPVVEDSATVLGPSGA